MSGASPPTPSLSPAHRPFFAVVSGAIKSLFPAVSTRTLLRHYLPLSGALSHTFFTLHIFAPSLYTRLFSTYDLAISNAVLFNAHLGIGFYIFFRPHMFHLWRWRRVEFSVFASVMFNFGSLLCSIFVKGIFPAKIKVLPRSLFSVLVSIFLMTLGRRYVQHIDQRAKLSEFCFGLKNQQQNIGDKTEGSSS
ncbi:hypothetical protein niasHS_011897 [Heterodera schachtii]|uniref:Uncharacterized protein n=1 Tax=Heterodera schachtii TaxID=97005 RepID=A0ABD2IQX7_HETSC